MEKFGLQQIFRAGGAEEYILSGGGVSTDAQTVKSISSYEDSFDAGVAEGSCKPALKREAAIGEIRSKTVTRFDAVIVKAFMDVVA